LSWLIISSTYDGDKGSAGFNNPTLVAMVVDFSASQSPCLGCPTIFEKIDLETLLLHHSNQSKTHAG
jgi:hypothetical protein